MTIDPDTASPSLDAHRIPGAPNGLYYIPHWLSTDDATTLWQHVHAPSPKPTSWTQLRGRRVQHFGGIPTAGHPMLPSPLPAPLRAVATRVARLMHLPAPPNHCLLNAYDAGQGILPHEDGPLYAPWVASVSLGSAALLAFYPKPLEDGAAGGGHAYDARPAFSVYVAPRSLLVFTGALYTDYRHGITPATRDTLAPHGDGAWRLTQSSPLDADGEGAATVLPVHEVRCVDGCPVFLRHVPRSPDGATVSPAQHAELDEVGFDRRRSHRVSLTFRRVPHVLSQRKTATLLARLQKTY